MKEEKILTLHPQEKKGVNISLAKYEQIKMLIIETIQREKEITFEKLTDLAVAELTNKFEGKVTWYLVSIKLDLEARKIIMRVPKTSSQILQMASSEV